MFFKEKSVTQVAALPLVPGPSDTGGYCINVLLITSRRKGRWLLPKGWPNEDAALAAEAAREAREEAGILGLVADAAIGSYHYKKKMAAGYSLRCQVFVFPLLVVQQRLDWPERGKRQLQWLPLAAAAEQVFEADLARLLRQLARPDDGQLKKFIASQEQAAYAAQGKPWRARPWSSQKKNKKDHK